MPLPTLMYCEPNALWQVEARRSDQTDLHRGLTLEQAWWSAQVLLQEHGGETGWEGPRQFMRNAYAWQRRDAATAGEPRHIWVSTEKVADT